VVITDSVDRATRIETTTPDDIPDDMMVVDIGPRTRDRYEAALVPALSAFWNGPMGVFEVASFSEGTMSVARALAQCSGFTVVGGGESVMAIHRAEVGDRLSHVSTGGGASLKMIAGDTLPAVVALEAP
jgi:phosphoglycerate kinase